VTTSQLTETMASLEKRLSELLNKAKGENDNNRYHRPTQYNNRRGTSNRRDYGSYKCYECQELGHIARNCPKNAEKADQSEN
jgi:hypothetical protein